MARTRKPAVPIANLDEARFRCVFPTCGGICCKNGRPGVDPGEERRIARALRKFLPHLRPEARRRVEKSGWLSRRRKAGRPVIAVTGGWCVFFNEGCVLHKVGAAEGNRWRYKPSRCITFPLERLPRGQGWYVRQWGVQGEAWDLFCLNPEESPRSKPAETLAAEIAFVERLESGREAWRV